MAEETGSWHRMIAAGDLPDGEIFAAKVGDVHVALYNVDGAFFATDNVCTHAFALLSDGWLDGTTVECPLHGAQFDVQTGKALSSPAECDLRTFPTRVNDGQVEVLLGE
ncbi:non-heme iron oxygenase ferredoxin subunit [Roseomonas sp. E05]|uniref:non-heme iron oxygenase ferredoxin subunit n=1 Tax=Roseomonas sp. E05 TaxID=3046310 RepID=UPI0024BAF428|nr:non-heme iron oxygenase ferredoxin subunit [Roseomonas sp. E05]MDJ0389180.1 non-heme iron oxygenase ferredoxin subunit [Roseomonas sp. E05]